MDTEGEVSEKAVEVHCLITEDTLANGKIHEPIHPRRLFKIFCLSLYFTI